MKEFKNPFAYDVNNNIVYIETGNESKKDLYKNCHCPICNEILIPKMGNKNTWHFAHKGNSNCSGGFETGLHLYAKKVIKKNSQMLFPEINLGEALEMHMFSPQLVDEIFKWEWENDLGVFYTTVFEENKYNYTWVGSEIKINNFIPDSIIEINKKNVAIEIFVSHGVDDEKKKKVKIENLDMLEIYLDAKEINRMQEDENFDLANYILFGAKRKWIHKTSNNYFDEKIKKIIYNTRNPIINEQYTSKYFIERSKHFLICPMCNGRLVERNGKNGPFYACINFPKCKFTKDKLYDVGCPKCGKKLYILDGKYGKYYGHLIGPFVKNDCTFTRPIRDIEKFLI